MGSSKHRTQISLEIWQYEALMEESRKTRKSLAGILRDLVAEKFSADKTNQVDDPIMSIIGLGSGDGKAVARNHDTLLYDVKHQDPK